MRRKNNNKKELKTIKFSKTKKKVKKKKITSRTAGFEPAIS